MHWVAELLAFVLGVFGMGPTAEPAPIEQIDCLTVRERVLTMDTQGRVPHFVKLEKMIRMPSSVEHILECKGTGTYADGTWQTVRFWAYVDDTSLGYLWVMKDGPLHGLVQ